MASSVVELKVIPVWKSEIADLTIVVCFDVCFQVDLAWIDFSTGLHRTVKLLQIVLWVHVQLEEVISVNLVAAHVAREVIWLRILWCVVVGFLPHTLEDGKISVLNQCQFLFSSIPNQIGFWIVFFQQFISSLLSWRFYILRTSFWWGWDKVVSVQ